MNQCWFCKREGQLLYSSRHNCFVHAQCIVNKMTLGVPLAIDFAKEFDMISDSSDCSSSGCDECKNRWCGRY